MSRSATVAPVECAERICVDDGRVWVEFPGGLRRPYCEHHASHVIRGTSAEVVE